MIQRFLAFILLAFLFIPAPVQAEEEHIAGFESAVRFNRDSTAEVVETIDYRFAGQQKNGLVRKLPVKYTNSKLYFKFIEAQIDGKAAKFTTGREGINQVVRIKGPDKLSGKHTFKLHYVVYGVVSRLQSDNVSWNATGFDLDLPVKNLSVQISGPDGIKNSNCFTGLTGFAYRECQKIAAGRNLIFKARNLQPGENLTVHLLWPKGTFYKPSLLTRAAFYFENLPAKTWILFILPGALSWAAYIARYYYFLPRRTIKFNYEPPDGLTPAEVAILSERKHQKRDIAAAIIDLAIRGYVTIHREKGVYSLSRTQKSWDGLHEHELKMLYSYFQNTIETAIDKLELTSDEYGSIRRRMYESLAMKGYYLSRVFDASLWMKISAICMVVLAYTVIHWLSAALILAAIILDAFSFLNTEYIGRADRKYAKIYHLRGLRLYLKGSAYEKKVAKDYHYSRLRYEKFFAYGVAMNVLKRWSKLYQPKHYEQTWFVSDERVPDYLRLVSSLKSATSRLSKHKTAPMTQVKHISAQDIKLD